MKCDTLGTGQKVQGGGGGWDRPEQKGGGSPCFFGLSNGVVHAILSLG